MNEQIYINLNKDDGEHYTDRVCKIIEKIGWKYDRDGDKIQVAFKASEDNKTDLIICVADILSDKIHFSTSTGIRVTNKDEMLRLLNFINCSKIYYGRFVITSNESSSVWYDFTFDFKLGYDRDNVYRAFSIADNCVEHFCNAILNVAVGTKTAEQAIQDLS